MTQTPGYGPPGNRGATLPTATTSGLARDPDLEGSFRCTKHDKPVELSGSVYTCTSNCRIDRSAADELGNAQPPSDPPQG